MRAIVAVSLSLLVGCAGSAHAAHGVGTVPDLTLPFGFNVVVVARVPRARELVSLPNGDLVAGTEGSDVYIVPHAEATTPGEPKVFATLPGDRAAGVAFSPQRNELYIGTENGIYVARYVDGAQTAANVTLLAHVRSGTIAPNSDGDVHVTTSVAYVGDALYAGVGSSCNACIEVDPTRASILRITASAEIVKRATRFRNAIALFGNPLDGALWAGGAGQDALPYGHPYEFLDDVSLHRGVADYGWPDCEENQHAYTPGADCTHTVVPLVVLPAYSTIIGATFYPISPRGRYAFPMRYRGALFVTAHGSWHRAPNGDFAAMPQVVVVPMRGAQPKFAVDWKNPDVQWQTFVGGFQHESQRSGRPTGIAVGSEGSLFVADDQSGVIYRIRPK